MFVNLSAARPRTVGASRPTERGGQRGQIPGAPTKQGPKKQERAPQSIEIFFNIQSYY